MLTETNRIEFKRELTRELDLEALGSGMNRIMRVYGRENFEFGGNDVRMIVPYNWVPEDGVVENDIKSEQQNGITAEGSTANGTANNLTDKEKELVDYIIKYPDYAYEQYAELTSFSRRTIARMIKRLQEINVIQRIGSDKNGHWKVIGQDEKKGEE